ncbi:hypothetical protein PDIG_56690 [Penicillium digitatum PHI26]|uniref:Uncharacterized protein n=2 Tax=Penicillium digitatum TaxID=36651 RepID=K9FLE4_PEND2|nr:hypothetical protein PDIP_66250 [Penicillium digitatum Pd1]EKV09114.1 hypothetical protein PDIP_66250 [Penicillium digitatum Pd1]EKV10380.1 hypothetical protein PDIG_56690 [Penicillium digitatum PHI26]
MRILHVANVVARVLNFLPAQSEKTGDNITISLECLRQLEERVIDDISQILSKYVLGY